MRRIVLILCLAAASAVAQPLPESLRGCAAESDGARRLSCYDREVARLSASPAAAPTAARPQAAPAPPQEFGLTPAAPGRQSLTAHISAVSVLPYGRQRLVLDNAQVWEQTEEDWGFAPHSGMAVTITHGTLGGFWMTLEGQKKVRVKRVR